RPWTWMGGFSLAAGGGTGTVWTGWPGRCTLTTCSTPGLTCTVASVPSGSVTPSTVMTAGASTVMTSVASCGPGVSRRSSWLGGGGGGVTTVSAGDHSAAVSATPATTVAAEPITTMRRQRDADGGS